LNTLAERLVLCYILFLLSGLFAAIIVAKGIFKVSFLDSTAVLKFVQDMKSKPSMSFALPYTLIFAFHQRISYDTYEIL